MTTIFNRHTDKTLLSCVTAMWRTRRLFTILLLFAFILILVGLAHFLMSHGPPGTFSLHGSHHHHHPLLLHDHLYNQLDSTQGSNSSGNLSLNKSGEISNTKALLRILVLTYNRAKSLSRCLSSLNAAHYDGYSVTVDIHMDRAKDGTVHNETLHTSKTFVFQHGTVHVHVRPRHMGLLGQWLGSWLVPRDNASEIAVFIEDDITVSPYFARWLRRVHGKYDKYPGIAGYTLQAESIRHAVGAKPGPLQGPPGETVFLYPVLGSWGFSPNTGAWREFLRWYHKASKEDHFIPHVSGLKPSVWYQDLYKAGRADTMWTMWHICYTYTNKQYTVYPHLPQGRGLAFNWKEPGEHYSDSLRGKGMRANVLEEWREEEVELPEKLVIIDAKGGITGETISSEGLE